MIKLLYEISGNLQYSIIFGIIIYLSFCFDILYLFSCRNKSRCNFVISGLITAAVFWVAGAMGFTLATAGLAMFGTIVGYLGAALIYGGIALAMSQKASSDFGSMSPTYANPTKQTQTNPDLPLAMLYGQVKLAGNRIWQADDATTTIKRIVAFAEGEIEDFTDIRLNDIPVNEISGITVNKYYGTLTQEIDPIVPGATHLDRCEIVGSLRGVAYLAITVPRSEKIDANYNLTTIVKGRKVRVYTSPTAYTVKYSTNPAWVLLDFLTSYNGLGLGLNNNGTKNDVLISKLFDINSFLESSAFCAGLINNKPRFAFNMIFDAQTSARSLMDEIYRNCRGGLFTKNGKLQNKIDKADAICQVLTADDIIQGSETFNTLPSEEHYDILKCVFVSPDHEWQKVEAYAEIPEYRDGVPIEHSVNMYSCIDFEQASRLAWYYVNSKRLQPNFRSFQSDYRVYNREVGDVIKYYSTLMGQDVIAKVTSLIDTGTGIFTVNVRDYDERLYTDELGSKEPKVLISSLNDAYGFPSEISSFSAVQNKTLLQFSWVALEGSNITYEIRQGVSWETGSIIAPNISGDSYITTATQTGILKYWIKAKSKYQSSKNSTSDVLNIDSIPELNEILTLQPIIDNNGFFSETTWRDLDTENWNELGINYYTGEDGSWSNKEVEYTEIIDDVLSLKVNGNWQEIDSNWQESGYAYYIDGLNYWNTSVFNEGYYTSAVYDIGDILTNFVNFYADKQTNDETATYSIEYRISDDNIIWSSWVLAVSGQYSFRYIQTRITLSSPNNNIFGIKNLKIKIDVPDREEKYTNREITNANLGLTITYATDSESKITKKFNIAEPHVIATPKTLNAMQSVAVSTTEHCTIKLTNSAGNFITGFVNITVSGY